jgi:DNA-binding NtrC family response regulator
MADESILIVGEQLVYGDFASDLVGQGWQLSQALELAQGLDLLRSRAHDLAVIDADSLTDPLPYAIQSVKAVDPDLTILLVAPPGAHLEGLDQPLLRPAGLLVKPLEKDTLMIALESALVHRKLLRENRALKRQLGSAFSLGDWVGCTPESQEVRKAVATAALSTGPVLLLGERGTGRRLAAELIHRHGRNRNATFLPVEIVSLPRGELSRWLEEIGAEGATESADPGSFGRQRSRPGAIYFTEMTALSPLDQEALSQFLDNPVPFRVMGSADPSIHEAVHRGDFDRRLFYQLSAVRIAIPPLRARRGDIPALVGHFLKRSCDRFHLKPMGVPPNIIESYMAYDWPGNVAELSMVIERAVSIASAARFEGNTLPEQFCGTPSFDFPDAAPPSDVSLRDFIADIERRVIIQTLARVDGSQKKAAERLRVNPTTLHEKMKRHKILP